MYERRVKPMRTHIVSVRMSEETRAAAELVAQLTCRTLSSLSEYALRLYIEKNYPDALVPGAKVTLQLGDAPGKSQLAESAPGAANEGMT